VPFTSFAFAVFLAVVFVGAWLLRPWPVRWKGFLLLASVVFFGWADWKLCLVLAAVIVAAQAGTTGVQRSTHRSAQRATGGGARRAWVLGSIAAQVAVFVIVARVGLDGIEGSVVVPLGVALLIMRGISYVVDVDRAVLAPAPILDLAVAIGFFPAVVAGPLARPSQLLPQLQVEARTGPPDPRRIPAARAFRLLVVGLIWLWVVAPFLASELVDPVFADPGAHSAAEVLVATYGFTVQLFASLAGAASMAIGTALLLGLRLPENFAAPLVATSLRAFWRRWTVTFSLWFRDYVYAPLGGSRVRGPVEARNLVVVLVVSGLLLVGGWTGLLWGVLMGLALVIERAVTGGRRGGVLGWLVTVNVVAFGWMVVRAGDVGTVGELLGRLTAFGEISLVTPLVLAVIAGAVVVQLVPRRVSQGFDAVVSRLPLAVQAVGLALALLAVDALSQGVTTTSTGLLSMATGVR
jgi:D-alanyl-lipoteichoic acid acyltransferase DltB (MBOAT superfamily)